MVLTFSYQKNLSNNMNMQITTIDWIFILYSYKEFVIIGGSFYMYV